MDQTPEDPAAHPTPGDDRSPLPAPSPPPQAIPRDAGHRTAVLAHLTEFLGDDYSIAQERISHGISLDLVVFAPSAMIPHPTLVTLGMSERPMRHAGSEREFRMELLMGLPTGWPGIDPPERSPLEDPGSYWPINLLKTAARIPSSLGTAIDWGDTVTNGGQQLHPSVPFTAALVGPPFGYSPAMMDAPTPNGDVRFLAVFPLTAEELALAQAMPGGGDLLLSRFSEQGVTALLDPRRPSVTTGPPPWRAHLLLTERYTHLGQVLAGSLPHLAVRLAETQSVEEVIPAVDEPLRWLLGGRFSAARMDADLARAVLEAPRREALESAIRDHGSVLTLSPERPGGGEPIAAVAAMVSMLIEAGVVAAIWLPQQHHLTVPEQFTQDIKDGLPISCRVHEEELADGRTAAMTHGLAALGGTEILLSDESMSLGSHLRRLSWMVADGAAELRGVPEAGQKRRISLTNYTLREGSHPDTGAPVLEMIVVKGPGLKERLFGRKR